MNKLLLLGRTRAGKVFVTVNLKDNKLSMTGVIGPRQGGNCQGGCGQIVQELQADQFTRFNPPWTKEKIAELLKVWERWHLNDMRAGTVDQEQWLLEHAKEAEEHRQDYYTWACEALQGAGLNPDQGYAYGSQWLKESLPEAIERYLEALPESEERMPWGW